LVLHKFLNRDKKILNTHSFRRKRFNLLCMFYEEMYPDLIYDNKAIHLSFSYHPWQLDKKGGTLQRDPPRALVRRIGSRYFLRENRILTPSPMRPTAFFTRPVSGAGCLVVCGAKAGSAAGACVAAAGFGAEMVTCEAAGVVGMSGRVWDASSGVVEGAGWGADGGTGAL
jgi:hypothetical protein